METPTGEEREPDEYCRKEEEVQLLKDSPAGNFCRGLSPCSGDFYKYCGEYWCRECHGHPKPLRFRPWDPPSPRSDRSDNSDRTVTAGSRSRSRRRR